MKMVAGAIAQNMMVAGAVTSTARFMTIMIISMITEDKEW